MNDCYILLSLLLLICFKYIFIYRKKVENSPDNNKKTKLQLNNKSQYNQDIVMYFKYFYNVTNGFFFEIGAYDGITISNTYLFEKNLNWNGILVEGGRNNCKKLISNSKKRSRSKLICSPICKSTYVTYSEAGSGGKIFHNINITNFIKCNTIRNITHFYNIKHIDLFSLDVEGSELEVLETFDFNVTVSYWLIEFNHLSNIVKEKIIYLLKLNGYKMINEYISEIDVLFSHI